MKRILILALLCISLLVNGVLVYKYSGFFKKKSAPALSDGNSHTGGKDRSYYNALDFSVVNRIHNEANYNRLPAKYKSTVRPDVWRLSTHSSGIAIAFKTNSRFISVRWRVKTYSTPVTMNKIGANGVDIYCFKEGKWQYVSSGAPTGKENESLIITGMDSTMKDFMLYLPLYDGTENVQIGVSKTSEIKPGTTLRTGPENRIIFYGTSITQGGAASRPGMNYPSVISRHLNTEVINFGFSGNGRFETSVGKVLCDIDSKLIVLDCAPNSYADTIRVNVPKLLRQIRACKPTTPVLLVESIIREYAYFKVSDSTAFGSLAFVKSQNDALRRAYRQALAEDMKNLHYLEATDLIGSDHEGTVDGTHLSDLGLLRMAEAIENKTAEILKTDREAVSQ